MPQRQRSVRWGLLLLSLLPMLVLWIQLARSHSLRDRWTREDLEQHFPAGASSQALLLVNDGSGPAFAEVRNAAWDEPRPELLLPGDSQLIQLPATQDSTEVRMTTLDVNAPGVAHVVPLPTGWYKTFVRVDEAGEITSETRNGGDYSPKRGYVGVDSDYALPVRVEVPFDAHEKPTAKDLERRAWIGPGVRWQSEQCAFALDRETVVRVWVPQRATDERTIQVGPSDGATRLTMRPDGTVERDALPMWRQVAQLAGF